MIGNAFNLSERGLLKLIRKTFKISSEIGYLLGIFNTAINGTQR